MENMGRLRRKIDSILVNDILLDLARRDAAKLEMEELEKRIRLNGQALESDRESSTELESRSQRWTARFLPSMWTKNLTIPIVCGSRHKDGLMS